MDVSSLFALLLLGASLSFMVFLIELIWHRIINKHKTNILELPNSTMVVKNNDPKEGEESHFEENCVEGKGKVTEGISI